MELIQAFITVIAFGLTKGVWGFGAYVIVRNVAPAIKERFATEEQMSDEDIFNTYG